MTQNKSRDVNDLLKEIEDTLRDVQRPDIDTQLKELNEIDALLHKSTHYEVTENPNIVVVSDTPSVEDLNQRIEQLEKELAFLKSQRSKNDVLHTQQIDTLLHKFIAKHDVKSKIAMVNMILLIGIAVMLLIRILKL